MNKDLNICGREFELPITVECYEGEEITEKQINALNQINSLESKLNAVLCDVKNYVFLNSNGYLQNSSISNIFKYVIPQSIFIQHNSNHSVFAVMCDFKFDIEHGLSIIFEDGEFKRVGSQDEVL